MNNAVPSDCHSCGDSGNRSRDLVVAIDQDVGDGRIFKKRLERAQAKDLIQNFPRQTLTLGEAEGNRLAVHGIADQQEHFFPRRLIRGAPQLFQIQAVQNLAVQVRLDLLVFGPFESLQVCHGLPS